MKKNIIPDFTKPAKNFRPSWDEYFLQLSDLVATRATCRRLKVGAILVKDRKIISTGYNGAPKKIPDCFKIGCLMRDGHCVRTIHAEINAVAQAAYHGTTVAGSDLYANWLPCYDCAKVLINAGIEKIVYRREYRPDLETKKLLHQAKIKLVQLAEKKKPKLILGFVGKFCAGKGQATSYLVEKHGFYASSCSDRIREEILKTGKEITREKLQETGGKLRQKFGPAILAKRTWKDILEKAKGESVVDSIRGVEEVKFLKTLPNFHLIALEADQQIRFERMKIRRRESDDPQTFKGFQRTEIRDLTGDGRNIEGCLKMADFQIENNGTLEKLYQKLDKLLKNLDEGVKK